MLLCDRRVSSNPLRVPGGINPYACSGYREDDYGG